MEKIKRGQVGYVSPLAGRKRSIEVRRKIALGHLGKPKPKHTAEHNRKLGLAWKGRQHTEETRRKMSLNARRGPSNHFWRGGTNPVLKMIRHSVEYKLWRESVFRRDNWTCVFCSRRSTAGARLEIHADHIKPFSLFPELRFAIDNGRTLCVECHKNTDTFGEKIRTYGKDS